MLAELAASSPLSAGLAGPIVESMIEVLSDLPASVLGVRASGTISADDYESVLIPAIEAVIEEQKRVRLLYVMDCSVADFSLGAVWDDAKLGFEHLRDFERIAIVADDQLIRGMVRALHFALPGHVQLFEAGEQERAAAWLAA